MVDDIWFTSDTHFNHKNIIKYSKRPFSTEEEMERFLINNWNSKVKPGDRVYHLGDFALSYGPRHLNLITNILSQLNGQKYLIIGNHDRKEVIDNPNWQWAKHYFELKVDLGGQHKQRIVMSHYSLRVWNQMHRGAWMLYGHSHGNLPQPFGKTMDVGVDPNNYTLLNIQDVKSFMDSREMHAGEDHHGIGPSFSKRVSRSIDALKRIWK